MKPNEIENLEIELLLEAVFRRYGYDFRSYARASIERRIRQFLSDRRIEAVSEAIPLVLHDGELFWELARCFSVSFTDMFRDPFVFRAVREKIVPLLKTYPFVRIWNVGCATGEEVYSLAILFTEEQVYGRTTIFGTDFNQEVLERARQGIYPADRIKDFTQNYQEAGGTGSFSEYYHAVYDSAVMSPALKKNLTFACHNLTVDGVFGEMHLVFCRNVLIYFNNELKNRALGLIADSLVRGGFLCLGTKEDLRFSETAGRFDVVDERAKIYRKKVEG